MQLLGAQPQQISQIVQSLIPELMRQVHQDQQLRLNSEMKTRLEMRKGEIKEVYNLKLQEEIQNLDAEFSLWYQSESLKAEDLRRQRLEREVQTITVDEESVYMRRVLNQLVDDSMLKEIKAALTSVIQKTVAQKYAAKFQEECRKVRRAAQQSHQRKKAQELRYYKQNIQQQGACKTESLLKDRAKVQQQKSTIRSRVQRERQEKEDARSRYQQMTEAYNVKISQMKQELKELRQRYDK